MVEQKIPCGFIVSFFEVQDLHRVERCKPLLSAISTSVERGEAVAILGPSGAGKTVLLRALAFVDRPSKGEIRLHDKGWSFGRMATRITPPWPAIVIMFQSGGIVGHISVIENIVFPYRGKRNWASKKVMAEELCTRFGLMTVLHQPAALCSVGQKQRASFIRAIVSDAELLLLDEPTASLDPGQTENIGNVVLEQKNLGRAFFISTHMLGFAMRVCDRFLYIQDGMSLETGPMHTLHSTEHPDLRRFVSLSSVT